MQNLQGITATASTSTAATSSIAAIAAIAGATTTAPIVGKVGVADPVDDESAKENHGDGQVGDANPVDNESANENHGDGKVGNADPVHNKSAKEDHSDGEVGNADPVDDESNKGHINLLNTYNWIIEGVEELDKERVRHMNAFYALLRKWLGGKEYTSKLITKEDHNAPVNFLLRVKEGDTDCCKSYLTGNLNAYNWLQRYHVYKYADDSAVLVLCPKKIGAVNVTKMPLNSLQQLTYVERLFIDLWKIHQADHCKGVTFYYRIWDKHGNVTREVCKLFTDVCPHCIAVHSHRRPTAGIQPIITLGISVRGQTNIIYFQSMPDGPFKFLLNYIDH